MSLCGTASHSLWGYSSENGCISNSENGNLNSSCQMPTGEDGHTGESAAGACPTGTKLPSSFSRHTRAFGAGWSGNAGMTALTSKASASEGSSRSYTAYTEQLLRIIQSIPSPKAEPFKLWLAQVGRERIEETIDPELTIDRALETYLKKGYSREWINQRLQAIQVRKELTDEWDARGVQKGVEYAILTDEISRAWSGMSTRQYKNLKGLKKENLRDNMTTLELVLNMLAEATTTEISKQKAPSTFSENMAVAREGGEAAGIARKAVEERTGVPVITPKNAAQLNQVVTDLLEGAVSDTTEESKGK